MIYIGNTTQQLEKVEEADNKIKKVDREGKMSNFPGRFVGKFVPFPRQEDFQDTCKELNLGHYFSRVRTPNDHAEIERYNRTIDEEFLQMGNYIDDVDVLNRHLTGWLVEYNFNRPHQSLGYATPIEFLTEKLDEKVLPMCPIRAFY